MDRKCGGNRNSVVECLRSKELRESSFRTRKGAAPLKLRATDQLNAAKFSFRTRKGAAPLKLRAREAFDLGLITFRTRKGAAPLKHKSRASAYHHQRLHSAPARVRPR